MCRFHVRSITEIRDFGDTFVTASADGKICTWKWDGTLIRVLEDGRQGYTPSLRESEDIRPIFNACPTPNNPPKGIRGLVWVGKYMISGALDGFLRVWNEETNELHAERQVEGLP